MARRAETLKLIALPLSRQPRLTYYYAHRIRQPQKPDTGGSATSAAASGPSGEPSTWVRWLNRGTDFGARQWDSLGKAPKGNWKWRIYMTGERLMDRIPFEEWALKGIDPALAPKPLRRLLEKKDEALGDTQTDGQAPEKDLRHVVPFIYPPSLGKPDQLLSAFRASLASREPHHRKWMKINLYVSPLTLPFALVPVIPNLPFFYLLWRAWSHWRALKASEYLNVLLARGLVTPQPSDALDTIYAEAGQSSPYFTSSSPASGSPSSATPKPSQSTPIPDGEPVLLLTKPMVPRIIEALKLGDEAKVELNRAVDQAKARIKNMEDTSKAQR